VKKDARTERHLVQKEKRTMTLREIRDLLNAEVLYGEQLLDREVKTGFACDLISDMLAFASSDTLLITTLTNPHVVHTAEVMDAVAVIFAGGKKPDPSVIQQGNGSRIPLLSTDLMIFKCCGLLYQNGVQGTKRGSIQ
jgi:predicted transcriptional regulator